MNRRFNVSFMVAILIGLPAFAGDPGKVISKTGNWSVYRSLDPMTDKPRCVAIYQDRFDIQMNEGELYVSLKGRGGVSVYRVRYDDLPAEDMKLASQIEEAFSMVNIGGTAFQKVLRSKRLRVQVTTVLDSLVNEDLDLTGIGEAHKVLARAQCNSRVAPSNEPPQPTSNSLFQSTAVEVWD